MKLKTALPTGIFIIMLSLGCRSTPAATPESFPQMSEDEIIAATIEAMQSATADEEDWPTGVTEEPGYATEPAETPDAQAESTGQQPACATSEGVELCYQPDPQLPMGLPLPVTAPHDSFMGVEEPGYIMFRMSGILVPDSANNTEIRIYPLEEYRQSSETASIAISDFEQLLGIQYDPPEFVPMLPEWNAAQLLHAKVKYGDAGCCNWIRFLTQYGQDASLIHNRSLLYAWQGISKDGQFLMSIYIPVTHPSLPANGDDLPPDFYNNFESYIRETQKILTEAMDNGYTPRLDLLDAFVQSITITP